MKKRFAAPILLALIALLTACGVKTPAAEPVTDPVPTASAPETQSPPAPAPDEAVPAETPTEPSDELPSGTPDETPEDPAPEPDGLRVLIAYFSCTGNTKTAAERLAAAVDADLYEITPEEPYTADDLDYNADCRANREQNDDAARPAIAGELPELANYDTVLLGYPIWWGTLPRIVQTFVESGDLSGKTVLPFCTSGSSGISQSVSLLQSELPDADVRSGLRMNSVSDADLTAWLTENGLEPKN